MKQTYQSFSLTPPKEFANMISHFYIAYNQSNTPITKRFVPNFQTILVFNFGNFAKLITCKKSTMEVGKCFILGPIKKSFAYSIPPKGQLFVVNFKDDAFYRFFGQAMVPQNLPIHPDTFLHDNCFDFLWHHLSQLKTFEEKIHHLLNFCLPYLKSQSTIACQLANFHDEKQSKIKAIAAETGLSERTIQQKHKKLFGFTSKEKIRYERFLNVINSIQQPSSLIDWQKLVFEFNYHDQSHLIHDFQHYMNITPTQYLQFQQDICLRAI